MAIHAETMAAAIVKANANKQGYYIRFSDGSFVGLNRWKVKTKRAAMVTTNQNAAIEYTAKHGEQFTLIKKRALNKAAK